LEKLEPLLAEAGVPAGAKDVAAVAATKVAAKVAAAAVAPVAARQYNIYNI